MKACIRCKGEESLVRYRDLDQENHCREDGRQPPTAYLCEKCISAKKEEYGSCEDCGDSVIYDIGHLVSVMSEEGLYCPKHARRYDESGSEYDADEDGVQDYIEYNTKDN